jgi:hypothetical protein
MAQRGIRQESREGEGRNTRVPLGVARLKMAVPEIQGYVPRWVNDDEGRIQQAQMGGYEFVMSSEVPTFGDMDVDNTNRDLGARVSRVVDRTTGKKAYLMKIKREFYEEDQREKLKIVNETDQAIRKGALKHVSNAYVPENGTGIKMD